MIWVILIAFWLGIGLGCWLFALATVASDRCVLAVLLLPVVMLTWPYLIWSVWETYYTPLI